MLLIADAGNTKTTWILTDQAKVLKQITGDGISPYFDDSLEIIEKIKNALASIPMDQVREIRYYGTGCLYEAMQLKMKTILAEITGKKSIAVSDDLTAAALAVFGKDRGLIVVSGTGSNAGVCAKGVVVNRIKSLGYLLGDEGSGADIGFRFLKKHLSGGLPDEVADRFREMAMKQDQEILKEIYSRQKPQAYAASFIPFIVKNLDIPEIITCVTSSFEAMFEQMILPLLCGQQETPLGFCGSVAKLFESEIRTVAGRHSLKIKTVLREPAIPLAHYLVNDL
ncbi:MAG: hypothetical protein R6V49_05975 [Bacteroidales bacterium]